MPQKKHIPIAILGATGAVGQKAIAILCSHPYLQVKEVAASKKSFGKTYGEAVQWIENIPLDEKIKKLPVKKFSELKSKFILSAIPSHVAKKVELELAEMGKWVFSNSSAYRMDPKVPLLIPEVNLEQLTLLNEQSTKGKRIANSNCVVAFIALALFPLLTLNSIESLRVVTLQSISGAGIKGLNAYPIFGNIIPHIPGEEEKIIQETKKILNKEFIIEPQVFRVPVLHGHTISLHLIFASPINIQDVWTLYLNKEKEMPNAYKIWKDSLSPQPARDLSPYDLRAHIGQIKQYDSKKHLSLVITGHNLVRGAAGATIRNIEATLEKFGVIND